jgi:hypothetical protein
MADLGCMLHGLLVTPALRLLRSRRLHRCGGLLQQALHVRQPNLDLQASRRTNQHKDARGTAKTLLRSSLHAIKFLEPRVTCTV